MTDRPKLVKPPVLDNISSPRVFYVHEWWNGYVRQLSELHKQWAFEDERRAVDEVGRWASGIVGKDLRNEHD